MERHSLELARGFIESHVGAAARRLEMLSPESAAALMQAIPLLQAQRLTVHMLPQFATRILQALPADSAAAMLSGCNSNQIAAVLRLFEPSSRAALLDLLPERSASRCRRLLTYDNDTVGAWMNTDVLLLPTNITAGDALQRVAGEGDIGDANTLPLVDEARKLAGFISIKNLLRASSESQLLALRRSIDPIAIPAKMSLRAAEGHEGWQACDDLVVVNQQGEPEGLLRHMVLRRALSIASAGAPTFTDEPVVNNLGLAYLRTLGALFNLVNGEGQRHGRPSTGPGGESQ
ncbi:MAG: CBS domain-containing protein [Gammaproteobacteria bacterium]|nr:CBS domain-containing protein [Gammaproteobacteria bacterium]MDH3536968.1 CBS domain-containing protein [Gammaproteobacteria bacterium]